MSKLYTITAEYDTYIQACFAASAVVDFGLLADVEEEPCGVIVRGISEQQLFRTHEILKLIGPKFSITEEVSE